MRDEWYFRVQDDVHGPVPRNELEQLARTGAFGLEDQIRVGAAGPWVTPSTSLFPAEVLERHELSLADAAETRRKAARAAQRAGIPGFADHHFGELIARRRGKGDNVITFALVALVAGLIAFMSLAPASGAQPAWVATLIAGVVAVGALYVSIRSLKGLLTVVYVHERGVIQRGPGGEVRLAYSDVRSLEWEVTRYFVNFFYGGSEVEFTATGKDGQRIHLVAKYKERPVAPLQREFDDEDPLDELRVRVNAATAGKLR